MFNFDYITEENIKQHKPNWSEIPDFPYKMLIIGGSGSRKTDALFNLIQVKEHIFFDIIYLYVKDPTEAKYPFLIKKREHSGLTLKRLEGSI